LTDPSRGSITIRRSWTYVGVPELRAAYDPPFEETPRLALPYLSVQLAAPNGRETPLIESRLSPGDPYSIFPRDVFAQLGVTGAEGIRARDPVVGEVRLVLLELRAFGDDAHAVVTRARVALPLEADPHEPSLGAFGIFSAFDVFLSRRRGIYGRGRQGSKR
jgi:hypothetical protein